jgi:hypothetical protein
MTITVGTTTPVDPCIANPSGPGCGGGNYTDWSQPIPTVQGCPTAATSARLRKLVWGDVLRAPTNAGQEYLNSAMNSGEVMAIKLQPSPSGRRSVSLTQGQGTVAPPQPVTELSISRCPGVIETNLPWQCYQRTNAVNFYSITAYNSIDPSRGTDQAMYSDGCLAASGEQFYVNIRWTFASCPFGARACAFTLQWGEGAF